MRKFRLEEVEEAPEGSRYTIQENDGFIELNIIQPKPFDTSEGGDDLRHRHSSWRIAQFCSFEKPSCQRMTYAPAPFVYIDPDRHAILSGVLGGGVSSEMVGRYGPIIQDLAILLGITSYVGDTQ